MTIKVNDLMRDQVIFCTRNQTIAQARELLTKNKIKLVPIVNSEMDVLGVVSSSDILSTKYDETTHVDKLMTDKVFTVPVYEKINMAARIMRNHKIHHLIVTEDKKLKGIISSFDLLKLMENKRFVEKNPSMSKTATGKRNKVEGVL